MPSDRPAPTRSADRSRGLDALLRGVISSSVKHRWAALIAAVLVLVAGWWAVSRLTLDVTPDISNVQVQILTAVPNLSPEEAETSVTRPIELEMFGLPGLDQVRSQTRFGVSQVSLVFADDTDIYRARQLVSERLSQIGDRLPRGMIPKLAPPSTGLGEIYTFVLSYKRDAKAASKPVEARLRRLKTTMEFVVNPVIRSVKGVAEINLTGGYDQQLVVAVDPRKLGPLGIDLNDVANQVERSAAIGGGALLDKSGGQMIARSLARAQTPDEVRAICVKMNWGAEIVPLANVATVDVGSGVRLGAATLNGEEAVLGTVLMLQGENAHAVARDVANKLDEVRTLLPAEMEIRPLYDRSNLIDRVIATVRTNLTAAAALVLCVLLVFLNNWKAAIIVTATLLLSFSLGLSGMVVSGIAGSLLSLGAIDFGVVVDDTVVLVENVVRRLHQSGAQGRTMSLIQRNEVVVEACLQVRKPMFIGMLIIAGMYLPILGLTGVEGKLFRPLAMTLMLILLGSLLMTLAVVPALCALGLTSDKADSREPKLVEKLRRGYSRIFDVVERHRALGAIVLALFVVGAVFFATRLGANFMPYLDEGWLVVEVQRDAGISLPDSVTMEEATERAIREEVPEVMDMFARIGMSSIATDPQGANQNDIYIRFHPEAKWRTVNGHRLTKEDLANAIKEVIERRVPGQDLALNQPIAVRFDELLEGVRTDVAVKLYGPDFDELDRLADKVAELARSLPEAGEVLIDRTGRTDTMEFRPDRTAMLRYMATAEQINTAISTALQGRDVGRIDDGEQFYPLTVRLSETDRLDPAVLNIIPFRAADGSLVLGLGNVGRWEKVQRVTSITREGGRRREAVMVSVKGSNVQGFVNNLRSSLQKDLRLPDGYRAEFAGAYKNLAAGTQRLLVIGLLVLAGAGGLVYLTLGSWRQTGIVVLGVPFAVMGGIYGLALRDLPMTMPAAVGLVTLSGLGILNGLVLVTYFNQLRARGMPARAAARESALVRLRPVLMTALVAGMGFIPMALSTSAGAEIQRPMATVVIAGVFSASALTLLVIPTMLAWLYRKTGDTREAPRNLREDRQAMSANRR